MPLTCPDDGYCLLKSFKLEMCSACRLKKFIAVGLEPRLYREEPVTPVEQPAYVSFIGKYPID